MNNLLSHRPIQAAWLFYKDLIKIVKAGIGVQEVGACLRKHIKQNLSHSIKELVLTSDSCWGQNRNSFINENTF